MAALSTAILPEHADKKPRLDHSPGPMIGTHNGTFHADEALAVYLLRLLPTYHDSPLTRTRTPDVLSQCHTVVDVGGVYDDAKLRYDHHQREFTTTFPNRSTKLSSAGLVYMHFGRDIIARQTGLPEAGDQVNTLFEKMYDDFIEAFDANDNGISAFDPMELDRHSISKRFNDKGFSLASVVGRLNYSFDPAEETDFTPDQKQSTENARFLEASKFTGSQFMSELTDLKRSWLPARDVVRAAFEERKDHDASGQVMVLKEGMPWMDHLCDIEKERGCDGLVLYTLFPENDQPDSKWRIRAVSKSRDGFELRKPLPEAWRGLRDSELSKVAQVDNCIFVHASGFIAGNATFDGALAMAKKALS
ncbi:MAG: hypothetical protein M1828_007176 [Chrysothrix sp. TS-e1954]|nr:MAG: hypothetical protein M1828_007176 [Chrysothrix sp. TS-e1954]